MEYGLSDMMDLHMSERHASFQKQCDCPVRISISGFFHTAEGPFYIGYYVPVGGHEEFHVAERAFDQGVCPVILKYRIVEIYFQIAEGTFQKDPADIPADDVLYGVSEGAFTADFFAAHKFLRILTGKTGIFRVMGKRRGFASGAFRKDDIQPERSKQGGAQYGPGG